MFGEYERVTPVTIIHSCGCSEEHLMHRQPGFDQIVEEMKTKPCSKCREAGSSPK